MNFRVIPETYGILVPRPDKETKLLAGDLELLDEIKEAFQDRFGELLTIRELQEWKYGKKGFSRNKLSNALNRLWACGYIERFATTLHTQSNRPNYASYYVWNSEVTEKPTGPQFY